MPRRQKNARRVSHRRFGTYDLIKYFTPRQKIVILRALKVGLRFNNLDKKER